MIHIDQRNNALEVDVIRHTTSVPTHIVQVTNDFRTIDFTNFNQFLTDLSDVRIKAGA